MFQNSPVKNINSQRGKCKQITLFVNNKDSRLHITPNCNLYQSRKKKRKANSQRWTVACNRYLENVRHDLKLTSLLLQLGNGRTNNLWDSSSPGSFQTLAAKCWGDGRREQLLRRRSAPCSVLAFPFFSLSAYTLFHCPRNLLNSDGGGSGG